MFHFEKLNVYTKSIEFNTEIFHLILSNEKIDRIQKDQIRRSSLSVALNIAEGSSRVSKADRNRFLKIAKGSLYETIANLTIMKSTKLISESIFENLHARGIEITRMLFGLEKV